MSDADDVVSASWLAAMFEALQQSSIVTGPLARVPRSLIDTASPFLPGDMTPKGAKDVTPLDSLFAEAPFTQAPNTFRGIQVASGGNFGFRRQALSQGYAAHSILGTDHATSLRAFAAGFPVGWAPDAKVLYAQRDNVTLRRIVTSAVGNVYLEREFGGVLWPRQGPRILHRIGWLGVNLPLILGRKGRKRWKWEFGLTLGTALEWAIPGFYNGRSFALRRGHGTDVALRPQTLGADGSAVIVHPDQRS